MSALGTARAVIDHGRSVELPFLAAAIAYYALVSVLPALLLAIAVATAVGGGALAEQVTAATGGLLTSAGQDAVTAALTGGAGRTGASVLGVVLLVWSTLKVFRGLDIAFSRVYGTSGTDSTVATFIDAGIGLVSVGVGLLAMVALGGALATLSLPVAGWLLGLVALLVGLFAAFLPLYYHFPDTELTVREAAPGAAMAAFGWVVLQAAFQAYAAVAPSFELYGVLGGVLLLVTWFYLGAALLLVGAAVNVTLAGPGRDRQAEKPAGRGG
ncbi:MAG: YhjD/YihY/BrkB family envelope integrity protein [Halobacteriales archaeon]|nr:YhjD/YihY/BrkB family envelope integrity protein [Halobacteriales archaeon]